MNFDKEHLLYREVVANQLGLLLLRASSLHWHPALGWMVTEFLRIVSGCFHSPV